MRAFTSNELARMRATADKALPDSCTIRRATSVSDGMGGQPQTWADVATVACRLSARNTQPAEGDVAGRLTNANDWIITLPYATDVTEKDVIAIGSRSFEVDKAQAHSWEISRRVLATEVV